MGTVLQGQFKCKGNEAEIALADLERALKRFVQINVGQEASFEQVEAAALNATNLATQVSGGLE